MRTAKATNDMMKIHVFPFLNRWAIFDEQAHRPKAVFVDPDEALKSARKILKNHSLPTKVFVHDKSGKIQSILEEI